MSAYCDQLDDYLAGLLDVREADDFQRHLANCGACRDEVRFQQSLDGLLRLATACDPPSQLQARIDQQIASTLRRPRLAIVGGLAIAASLMIAFVLPQRGSNHRATVQSARVTSPTVDSSPAETLPVVVEPDSRYLAVPQESRQPNVSIFWLYPTIKTASPTRTAPGEVPTERSES